MTGRIRIAFAAIMLLTSVSLPAQRLVILHTNDMHSRLNGFGPESAYTPMVPGDDETVGGFARLATLIRQERSEADGSALLLDAGDFLMGSFFHTLEAETGFQLALMGEMGYDAVAIGNHEFDLGPGNLAAVIRAASEKGVIPGLLLSNAIFSDKDEGDDQLAALYGEGNLIAPYRVIERNGLKIGIFSLLGLDAQGVAPHTSPVTFAKPVKTARLLASKLKDDLGADIVICLSHSGVWKQEDGSWGGEDVELAEKVPGIDIIISGHTHTHLFRPIIINGTPIVQAGAYGTFLGRLEVEFDDGRINVIQDKLLPVNDEILGDEHINELILGYQGRIEKEVLEPMGVRWDAIVAQNAFPLVMKEGKSLGQSNLGRIVADASFRYVNARTSQGTDMSFVASGMIRDDMLPGMQLTADVFRTLSLGEGTDGSPGYSLATVYVTGRELKGILEVLYIARSMGADYYVFMGGIDVSYDGDKGFLHKVQSAMLTRADGSTESVDFSKKNKRLYAITADTYLLEFMGLIRQTTKGLVRVTLKDVHGAPVSSVGDQVVRTISDADDIPPQEAKEWQALDWYLGLFPDTDGDAVPDVPEGYRLVPPSQHPNDAADPKSD